MGFRPLGSLMEDVQLGLNRCVYTIQQRETCTAVNRLVVLICRLALFMDSKCVSWRITSKLRGVGRSFTPLKWTNWYPPQKNIFEAGDMYFGQSPSFFGGIYEFVKFRWCSNKKHIPSSSGVGWNCSLASSIMTDKIFCVRNIQLRVNMDEHGPTRWAPY